MINITLKDMLNTVFSQTRNFREVCISSDSQNIQLTMRGYIVTLPITYMDDFVLGLTFRYLLITLGVREFICKHVLLGEIPESALSDELTRYRKLWLAERTTFSRMHDFSGWVAEALQFCCNFGQNMREGDVLSTFKDFPEVGGIVCQ